MIGLFVSSLSVAGWSSAGPKATSRGSVVDEAVDTYRKQLDLQLRLSDDSGDKSNPTQGSQQPAHADRPARTAFASPARVLAVRLRPGDDVVETLSSIARTGERRALAVLTCVGSLSKASVRFAGVSEASELKGPFEIVSMVGTLSKDGVHLHVCLADNRGQCIGGHLESGSIVNTTAEVVLVEPSDLEFGREMDPATGYPELEIRTRRKQAAPRKRRSKAR